MPCNEKSWRRAHHFCCHDMGGKHSPEKVTRGTKHGNPLQTQIHITRDNVHPAQRAALPVPVSPGAWALFVGRELQTGVHGAVQGEWEGVELSHLLHSLSTDQKSPDTCIRRMGRTGNGHISQTLSEPSAEKSRGELPGSSILHRGVHPVEQADLVTELGNTRFRQLGFSRAPTAPPERGRLPRIPRGGDSQTSTWSGNSFALQPPSPGALPWGDLGIPMRRTHSALGSGPTQLQESSCMGRSHTGLNGQAHISTARQPCSPLHACAVNRLLCHQPLGPPQSPPASWWASQPSQAAKGHPAPDCWPRAAGRDAAATVGLSHVAAQTCQMTKPFWAEVRVRQGSSDTAAPSVPLQGPSWSYGAAPKAQGRLGDGASLSQVPCRARRRVPGSSWGGCRDLGWLWAAQGAGRATGRRESEQNRGDTGPWQIQGLGCSPRRCSLPPMAFKGKDGSSFVPAACKIL